jgi:hypothetical protein
MKQGRRPFAAPPQACATLAFMRFVRVDFFFGYFWFSNAPGGREI